MGHWLWVHLGIPGSGPWYGFWSGFGSDLGEVTLVGFFVAGLHYFNCHEYGCWRIGSRVTVEDNGHHFRRCKKHHDERHSPTQEV